jgi:hypothetical protein
MPPLSAKQLPPSTAYPGILEQQSPPRAELGFVIGLLKLCQDAEFPMPQQLWSTPPADPEMMLSPRLPQLAPLLPFPPLSPSNGQALEREKHVLIGSQHLCILNSMLVNQNELKRSSSGLRVLKISLSICWVLRIKTTGGQLVAVLNKSWLLCPPVPTASRLNYRTPNNAVFISWQQSLKEMSFPWD